MKGPQLLVCMLNMTDHCRYNTMLDILTMHILASQVSRFYKCQLRFVTGYIARHVCWCIKCVLFFHQFRPLRSPKTIQRDRSTMWSGVCICAVVQLFIIVRHEILMHQAFHSIISDNHAGGMLAGEICRPDLSGQWPSSQIWSFTPVKLQSKEVIGTPANIASWKLAMIGSLPHCASKPKASVHVQMHCSSCCIDLKGTKKLMRWGCEKWWRHKLWWIEGVTPHRLGDVRGLSHESWSSLKGGTKKGVCVHTFTCFAHGTINISRVSNSCIFIPMLKQRVWRHIYI